jgi:hypothetical protein
VHATAAARAARALLLPRSARCGCGGCCGMLPRAAVERSVCCGMPRALLCRVWSEKNHPTNRRIIRHFHFNIFNILYFQFQNFIFTVLIF